jgi:PAS domain S-box-containing protein
MKIGNKITISFFAAGALMATVIAFLFRANAPIVLIILAIPFISGICGFLVSKALFSHAGRLEKGTQIVASGNLEYHVGMDAQDEIGGISRDFDQMTESLRNARTAIDTLQRQSVMHEATIEELQKREEHFRRLFEQSNDAVFIYDIEGKIVDVNNEACEMLGYSRDVLLKIPFLDLQTEDEVTASKQAMKMGEEACSIRFESKFRRGDGTVIDVGISSSCVDLKRGVMQAIVSNITERKRLEKALKESEEKFRSFMETASDLMYITSKDGYFTYVNEAMCSVLGYYREEMIGLHVTEVFAKESISEYKIEQKKLATKGEVLYEPVWETKNRVKIYGEIKVAAIYDKNGEYAGSRGVFRDISERKKVERSQRLAQLGKLAADVAHEVNNPVMVISGNAELALMEGGLNEKAKKIFNIILEQCEAARGIVKRLLMFSRPSKGTFKEVSIAGSIDLIVDLVESQFMRKHIKIIKKTAFSLPPVSADEKQLQEVFMNLIRNAADAMPKGGKITITTALEEDNVRIDFTDTGEGISESDMRLIFDPFFTTKEHGTGLGLSVCYGIIKAHGGDLKYSSKLGKGTTATVVLPVAGRG